MAAADSTEDDAALAELLDSALADFESPKEPKTVVSPPIDSTASAATPSAPSQPDGAPEAKEPSEALAADLLGGLQQLYEGLQAEGQTQGGPEGAELLARLESQMGHLDSAMRTLLTPADGDEAEPGVQEMKEELRKLVDTVDSNDPRSADGAQNISQTMQDALRKLNADLPGPEEAQLPFETTPSGDPLAPFMEHMLSALLSREVLYVPMKGIVEKYPIWLDANAASLPPEKAATYRHQLQLMRDVCSEFEKAGNQDPDTMKVFMLVQKMQELGPPPEALVGAGDEDGANSGLPAALGSGDGGCPTM